MDLVAKRKQLEDLKEKALGQLHAIAGQLALVDELLAEETAEATPPAQVTGSNGTPAE